MSEILRIGMIAGEASGDILGADLIRALKAKLALKAGQTEIQFEGIGGPLMCAEGFQSHAEMERLAVMGLVEPLKRLPELLKIRKNIIQHFLVNPPHAFIGIDSPDFNLAIETKLRAQKIKTVHYVSPSVWAWRQKRIFKIAQAVDLMLTLFPFETDIYELHDVPVLFVGHPLADKFPLEPDMRGAREKLFLPEHGIDTQSKIIALLPGSRAGEVRLMGELFLKTAAWCAKQNPEIKFLLPAANAQRKQQIMNMMAPYQHLPITLLDGNSHGAMAAADVVLMASGTTTLEALLLKKPMVVAYKMAPVSYAIISRLIKSPFISLPNLLAGCELVPEIIQERATVENLGPAVMQSLEDEAMRLQLCNAFEFIHYNLKRDASARAAEAILRLIKK